MLDVLILYLYCNVEVKVGFHLISKSHGFETGVGKGELPDPDVDVGLRLPLVDAQHQLLQLPDVFDPRAMQLCDKQVGELSLSLGEVIRRTLMES